MLTPKTNSLTFWPKEVSREMSGITFCVCSILWISRCILVAISVIFFLTIRLEGRAPCRKEVRRRLRMKALRRRKRSHVWFCASKGVRKSLHKVLDLWPIRGMPMKEKKSYQIQKSDILKRVDKRMLWTETLVEEDQNRTECGERKYSNSTSSRKFAADLSVFAKEVGNVRNWRNILNGSIQNKCNDMRNVCDFVDVSRHPPWTELCVEFGNPQEDKIRGYWERVQHNITWKNFLKKFWMWNAWSIHHFPGRDRY